MFRKSALVALAAAASIGAVALSSTDALAFGSGASGMRVATGAMHINPGLRYGGYHSTMLKIVKLPPPIVYHPHHPHWHWWYWGWRHRYWFPPVVAGGVAGGVSASYAATAPASNHCNCLTKTYTPDGAVVFKDVCTNEMAMNPPAGPAAADAAQPQQQGYLQPPQQGYLQPQAQ